ncbi:MAG TPA: ABC transporter permease [Acidobacteriaceae bacterium]|jgi:predicted permease|nr:ABC transporter permease [Acidobacteriaceae bacterium]
MENLAQDIRYTIRTLLRAPGFSFVVILSIALAFAANATVFSVANGLLWGVLPVRDPGRMVMFSEGDSFSYPDYIDYRDQTTALFAGGIAAHFPLIPASIGGKGEPERVWGQSVSGNFFPMLDVPMALGRPILPEDDTAARDHVVVLSNGLWRRRFAGASNILNRNVALNGQQYTVVGVAPPGFYGVDRGIASEFWVPLAASEEIMPDLTSSGSSLKTARDDQWVMLDARLQPGVTRARAAVLVNVVKKRLDDAWHKEDKTHEKITLQTAGALIAGSETPAFALMAVLMIVVGLVLLVACANVANLLLARATGRQREIAIRLAVGAGRRQLVRQLLLESFLLALAGAGVGFLLAAVAAHAISSVQLPLPFPVAFDFNVDWRVAVFTLGLSAITALAFGLVPALRASRPDLVGSLKEGTAGFGHSPRSRMRNTLVIVQVSLSLVLLTTAGLFLRSLGNASSIDIGFKPAHLLIMSMDPKLQNYSHDKTAQFLSQLHDRVAALPGVRSVSFVGVVPLSIGGSTSNFAVDAAHGHPAQNDLALVDNVGIGYFQTMGIPLLRGRDFTAQVDGASAAIINETMAAHLFPGQDPIGRTLRQDKSTYTIVGMARNSKFRTIGEKPSDVAYLFLNAAPEKANSFFGTTILVRTSMDPRALASSVREQIAALDPNMAVFNTETMQQHVDKSLLLPRLSSLLLGIFGAIGLTLASIGLYGVMSYSVRRRTREIGIRMALGAKRPTVLRMILRQGLILTAIGLAIGLAIALALGRFTASLLYGTSGTDLLTFVTVSLVLLVTAAVAVLVPALRAAHVEPTIALHYE